MQKKKKKKMVTTCCKVCWTPRHYHNNNEYISKALNHSISNLHEAQSATCSIKTKQKQTNKQNPRHQEKAGDGWVKW